MPEFAVTVTASRARGRAVASLCRFEVSRVPAALACVAAILDGWRLTGVLAAWLLVAASCAVASALNDRADIRSDTVNGRQDRPLVTGDADERDFPTVVAGGLVAVVVAQLALPQPTGVAIALLGAVLGYASACEPLALQRRGLVGLVALGACYFVLPIALVEGLDAIPQLFPLAVVASGVLSHKDVRDAIGDREAGKRTMVVRYGERTAAQLAVLIALLGAAATAATVGLGWWIAPAAFVIGALARLAATGPRLTTWLVARVFLLLTAIALVTAL